MRHLSSIVLATVILLAAERAHAMGRYVTFELLAWNADGTAALIQRDESSSGQAGHRRDFIVVGDKTPTIATFTNTLDADTATEHVTGAACTQAAKDLAKLVAAKHFGGVTVAAGACTTAARGAVGVTAARRNAVKPTWIALPIDRPATPREATAMQAMQAASVSGEVATVNGKLTVVFWGENGDSSKPAHAVAVIQSGSAFVVGTDLR